MSGVVSWSLQAGNTCPGSKNNDGTIVLACVGCYAKEGRYLFGNVKKPRLENEIAWKHPEWVTDMVSKIKNQTYFRWFDSGDIYDLELAEKIYQVILQTPDTKHWLSTKMYKFDKFKSVLNKINSLPNAVVRFSSDSITGEYDKELHGSVIIPSPDFITDAFVCQSLNRGGKCMECKACWNKNIKTIAYVAHGKKIKKLLKEMEE